MPLVLILPLFYVVHLFIMLGMAYSNVGYIIGKLE